MQRATLALLLVTACTSHGEPPAFVETGHTRIVDPGPGEIRPSTQVDRLQFLPDVSDGLQRFGLAAAERDLEIAMRAHLRALYGDYDVAFVIDGSELAGASEDQVVRIDVMALDPNRLGLDAYDNASLDKDAGNLVRDEYV